MHRLEAALELRPVNLYGHATLARGGVPATHSLLQLQVHASTVTRRQLSPSFVSPARANTKETSGLFNTQSSQRCHCSPNIPAHGGAHDSRQAWPGRESVREEDATWQDSTLSGQHATSLSLGLARGMLTSYSLLLRVGTSEDAGADRTGALR